MRPKLDGPSDKHMEVYLYIVDHVEKHGFQPSQAEIARHFGVTKNAIQMRIKHLAELGWVEMATDGNKAKERAVVLRKVRFRAFYEGDTPPGPND